MWISVHLKRCIDPLMSTQHKHDVGCPLDTGPFVYHIDHQICVFFNYHNRLAYFGKLCVVMKVVIAWQLNVTVATVAWDVAGVGTAFFADLIYSWSVFNPG